MSPMYRKYYRGVKDQYVIDRTSWTLSIRDWPTSDSHLAMVEANLAFVTTSYLDILACARLSYLVEFSITILHASLQ